RKIALFCNLLQRLYLIDKKGKLDSHIIPENYGVLQNRLSNVDTTSAVAGEVLQYTGTKWNAQKQTDTLVLITGHEDFDIVGGAEDLHEALRRLDQKVNNDETNDIDSLTDNETITEIAWNPELNNLSITEAEIVHSVGIDGFSEEGHAHANHIDGSGLVGGVYDAATEKTWSVQTGRGLEVFEDSVRLSDDIWDGSVYDSRFVNSGEAYTGDVSGTSPDLTVTGIQGRPVSDVTPGLGSLLSWSGTEWGLTGASLTWADASTYIIPTAPGCSEFKIYDEDNDYSVKMEQCSESMHGSWIGLYTRRTGSTTSKGKGIHSYAGVESGAGSDPDISEMWGIYARAEYGARNYGVYGISTAVSTGCTGYGVYGEGYTAGGWFYGPENNGVDKAALIVENPSGKMLIDDNEIDSDSRLLLQQNSGRGVLIDGPAYIGGLEGVLRLDDGTNTMNIDGNEINSDSMLHLQKNSMLGVMIDGDFSTSARTGVLRLQDWTCNMSFDGDEINSASRIKMQVDTDLGVRIYGPSEEVLEIEDGTNTMNIDGDEINTDGTLYLQKAYDNTVEIHGGSISSSLPPLRIVSNPEWVVRDTLEITGHTIKSSDYLELVGKLTPDVVYGTGGQFGVSATGLFVYGDIHATGDLTKSAGSFLIDHPDDPYNKTLRHNFVESPVDLLIYSGKVRCDESGVVRVEMPDYYKSLVKEDDATFQLTSVGRPFPVGAEWSEDYLTLIIYGDRLTGMYIPNVMTLG
ncbi:MAG: hypothetical protein ACTSWQ_10465, partial [Candidatus Thorarchaeota archaeon]